MSVPTFVRRLAVAVSIGLLALGCAGTLEDPDRFTGDGPAAASCPPGTDFVADILLPKCASSACHDDAEPAASLDLLSAGLEDRLVDTAAALCTDDLLIDSMNPGASLMLTKLEDNPECGSRMPIAAPLTDEEKACARDFVDQVVNP